MILQLQSVSLGNLVLKVVVFLLSVGPGRIKNTFSVHNRKVSLSLASSNPLQ